MVQKINSDNFEAEVKESQIPVLIDFYADWCGPCKMMSPTVEAVSEKYAGKLVVGKINTDENMDLAVAYRVASIPYLALFKNGEIADQIVGYVPEAVLEAMIERNI